MAASTKIVAAVVKPTSPPASRRIAPAPRKPMPCTRLEAMRVEDVSPYIFASWKERMVNSADPMQTKALVRIPAGRRCRSRSTPIAAPRSAAKLRRRRISWREIIGLREFPSQRRNFTYLELELRQFREMSCSGVYLAALQRPQAFQPEFLHAKAAQHRPVDHCAAQRCVALISRAGQIAHKTSGKGIAGSRGIVWLLQRKRRHAEDAPRVHQHRAILSALYHQRRRPHFENLPRRAQQIVLIRKLSRLNIVDHQNIDVP